MLYGFAGWPANRIPIHLTAILCGVHIDAQQQLLQCHHRFNAYRS